MKREEQQLLELIKLSLNDECDYALFAEDVDWNAVIMLAEKQGVLAIAFDALEKLKVFKSQSNTSKTTLPAIEALINWFGQVSYMESVYAKYEQTLFRLANLFSKTGIRMLVMKGYGLSLNYPKPNHRPIGDIDIYLLNESGGSAYDKGNLVISSTGLKIDNSHHKHSVFTYVGVSIENHYSFLNTHAHRSTAEIEEVLKKELNPILYKENVYFPSTKFNMLYLLRHSGEHFASVDMSLRVVLDWATFIKGLDSDERSACWTWLLSVLDEVGMKEYLAVLNAICVQYLGYDKTLFPELPVDKQLVERSLKDILEPEFEKEAGRSREKKRSLTRELVYRFRRWKANGWKHNMVYRERMWQSFATQIWSHLLKPSL